MTTFHSIESAPLSSDPITVKSTSCPNLSGKSTLTYHVACDSDNEINFRIVDNTGDDFFGC